MAKSAPHSAVQLPHDQATAAHRANPRRIGILLNGLDRKANTVALRFLILQMNRLQETFEYEFLPVPKSYQDDLLTTLRSNVELDRTQIKAQMPAFEKRYRAYLKKLNAEYRLQEDPPEYFIVICLASFDDKFYTTRRDGASVIALGNWKRHMAPPSIIEFLLTLVMREAIASVSPSLSGSIHFGTKGCLFDFTPSLDEVRFKVLGAFVCNHCKNTLLNDGRPLIAEEALRVMGKQWLGTSSRPGSPAGIVSKLGHDLYTTKGLKASTWEQLKKVLLDEVTKVFLALLLLIIGTALLAWLGLSKK